MNDDACVYVFLLFFYVIMPHCKLDWYICTILLMMYVLFCLTVLPSLNKVIILSYVSTCVS